MRRGPGISGSALTTSGTLPKGSITRISRMVAESSSDCIASAVFLEDAEVYRPSAETIGKNCNTSWPKGRPIGQLMQLHARLHAPAQETADGVERDTNIAVNRELVHFVERSVHPARDQSLDQHAASNQSAHQVTDRGELAKRDERPEVAKAKRRQRLARQPCEHAATKQ